MGRVVLVTAVAGELGARIGRRLVADPAVDQVIGVDVSPPQVDLEGIQFVRGQIRNPETATLLATAAVDTVVHLDGATSASRAGGRGSARETAVIATMQLLAACQVSPSVRSFVLVSSTAVYGASPRDPALFTEDAVPNRLPRSGAEKHCREVEGYVRGFGRRRPDVDITVLRCAEILGAGFEGTLTKYLRLPVVPTVLGFDPRLQMLHPDDAVDVVARAASNDLAGTYNVAGPGALTLSQALRRLGKQALPVPALGLGSIGRALRHTSRLDLSSDLVAFLTYGRVVDTTAVGKRFGYACRWSTSATLAQFDTGR